jgi:iron(III) transport system ATP-binding protein
MADVVLDSIAKRYGNVDVLARLDLRVSDGRTLAIVGPSGCGKTTILRLIAGFERPDAGTITIGGSVVSGPAWVPAHRRGIGYVPQEGGLFPHLTVAQNVTFGLDRADAGGERLHELLDLVSLDAAFASRRPDQLSGGEQQRVALARAMAIRPRLMLLDEPFSALDADLRGETRDAVRRLLDATGITAIVVTHDREDALDFADDVAVMGGGRVARIGPPAELYADRL